MRSKRDVDILAFSERHQFLNRFLVAYPGLLVAAVTSTEEMQPCIIDPDKVGLHASRYMVCPVQAACRAVWYRLSSEYRPRNEVQTPVQGLTFNTCAFQCSYY